MKIKRHVRAVYLVATLIGTGEIFLYFYSKPSILFPILQFVQFEVLLLQRLSFFRATYKFSTSS